ncbi:MAG: HEAT repeat domain-containing protein [Planctomycetes bacterium]|nr:HEAT repeat domain-containing protein [Planctomycetota bacterium]
MLRSRLLFCSWAVMFGLANVSPAQEEAGSELVRLVVGLLADEDKDVRALALEQVRGEAKGTAATKQFAAQLPKLSADAQIGLLSALAARGDGAARPAVLGVLAKSREESVRVAAVVALGSLGEASDLSLLVRTLAKSSKAEQAAARTSLVRLRGESVSGAIATTMKKSPPPLRVDLIKILVTRRALETIPDILSAAVDDDAKVRAAAMTALGKIAGPQHIAGMVRGVLKAASGRERSGAEKCVMFVCARISDPEKRADPLLAAIEKLKADDRTTMLSTLGRVGGPAALRAIEAVIADAELHDQGIRALCNWPNASIAPRLIELAESDPHAEHRLRALRALIRIAPLPDNRTHAQRLSLLKKAMTMSQRDKERLYVLDRAKAVRIPETLRFVMLHIDQPRFAEQACLTVVELAHHRGLREPNKAEFHRALDKVIATSKDAVVVDRANRYKKDQTWVRPKKK